MEPHYSRKTVLFCLLILVSFVRSSTTPSENSCRFPAIFNFGDSNSDTGGLSAAFGQAPFPNGETYFHTPSGRYSDGRLVIDFIGTFLPLKLLFLFIHLILLVHFTHNEKTHLNSLL